VLYVLQQGVANGQKQNCLRCAFCQDDKGCEESPDCSPGYWEQVGEKEAPLPEPKTQTDIEVASAAWRAMLDNAQDSKQTNPKDAIGIRKAPLSTLPMNVVAEMGTAMLEGAAKYGRHNYRGVGVRASVYFDATMRHLVSWWEGEDLDPDSGLSHITKALVSLAVLRDAMMQSKCEDDRPPRSVPFYQELNERSSAILDKHADKCPKHYTLKDEA